jgi:hypothetical protein
MVIGNGAADTCRSCSLQLNQDIRDAYKILDYHMALEGFLLFDETIKKEQKQA